MRKSAQGAPVAARVQESTGDTVAVAFVDQGYMGEEPAADAATYGIRLEVITLPQAKRGFVLLPTRWDVSPCSGSRPPG